MAAARAAPAVVYVHSEAAQAITVQLKANKGRDAVLHALLKVCGILPHVHALAPLAASAEQLAAYHSSRFLKALQRASNEPGSRVCVLRTQGNRSSARFARAQAAELLEHGICDDCPPWRGLWAYARVVAGGTLAGVRALLAGSRIALHLAGGRHHAGRSEASGFCFVNDVVLGALALRQARGRTLVVDIDCHHGDGTEAAFAQDDSVVTVSLHRHSPGFFPGTGGASDNDVPAGVLNVPFAAGVRDAVFTEAFDAVLEAAWATYRPAAAVLVCGVDGLARDPAQGGNLTHAAFEHAVDTMTRLCNSHSQRAAAAAPEPAAAAAAAPVPAAAGGGDGFAPPAPRAAAAAASDGFAPPPRKAAVTPATTPPHVPLLILGAGGYAPGASAAALARVVCRCASQSLPLRVPEHKYHGLYAPGYRTTVTARTTCEDENASGAEGGAALRRLLRRLLGELQSHSPAPCSAAAADSCLLRPPVRPQAAVGGVKRAGAAPPAPGAKRRAGGVRSRMRRKGAASTGAAVQ